MKYKAKPSDKMKAMAANRKEDEEQESSVLRDPEAAYMVERVRDGLDFAEFHAFREMIGVTEERLGALLGMSRETLHRRKKSGHLDRSESDRLVRYARVFHRAVAFFESSQAAAKWLCSPALAFNGESPLDYAYTEIGAREVEALILRIENGIPN